jgi:uncharacterized protein YdeI (YjbR/CyaY-like superfamily)
MKMSKKNPKVDDYLAEGCGRCNLYKTPQCKVHRWDKELKELRKILLACGLTEEVKWSQPCYTLDGNNIIMLSAFKEYAFLSFFKGSLLKDSNEILHKPGENSQAVRVMKFTNINEIQKLESFIKDYIDEAIAIEKSGLKVEFKKTQEPIPEEFQVKLDVDNALKAAFEALTPGRQRAYLLHFNGAKQSKTRSSRVEKYIPKILEGKGIND